jgi:hypothetical protein
VFGRKGPAQRDPVADESNLLNHLWSQQSTSNSPDLTALNSLYSPMLELDASNPFMSMPSYSNSLNSYTDFDSLFSSDGNPNKQPSFSASVVAPTRSPPTPQHESSLRQFPVSLDRKLGANRAFVQSFGQSNARHPHHHFLQSNAFRSNAIKPKHTITSTPLSQLFRLSSGAATSVPSAAQTVYHLATGSKSLPMLAVSPVIRLLDGEQHVLVKGPASSQPGQLLMLKSRRPNDQTLPVALSVSGSATDDLHKWINNHAIEQQFRLLKPETIKIQSNNRAANKWTNKTPLSSSPAVTSFNGDIITLEDIENAIRSGVMGDAFKLDTIGKPNGSESVVNGKLSKDKQPEMESQFSKQVMSAISFDQNGANSAIVKGQVFDEQIKQDETPSWSEQIKEKTNLELGAEVQTEHPAFNTNTNSNMQMAIPVPDSNQDKWRPVRVDGPWVRGFPASRHKSKTSPSSQNELKGRDKFRPEVTKDRKRPSFRSKTTKADEQVREEFDEQTHQEHETEPETHTVAIDQQKETNQKADSDEQIDYGFDSDFEQYKPSQEKKTELPAKEPQPTLQMKEVKPKSSVPSTTKDKPRKSSVKKGSLRRPLFGGRKPIKASFSLNETEDKEKSAAEEGSYFKQIINDNNAKQYELITSRPVKEIRVEDHDWIGTKSGAKKTNGKRFKQTSADDVSTGSPSVDSSTSGMSDTSDEDDDTSEEKAEVSAATTVSSARVQLNGEPVELVTIDDIDENEPETTSAGTDGVNEAIADKPEVNKPKSDVEPYEEDENNNGGNNFHTEKNGRTVNPIETRTLENANDAEDGTEDALGERAEESFRSELRSHSNDRFERLLTTESSLIVPDVKTASSQPLYTNYDENNYYNSRKYLFFELKRVHDPTNHSFHLYDFNPFVSCLYNSLQVTGHNALVVDSIFRTSGLPSMIPQSTVATTVKSSLVTHTNGSNCKSNEDNFRVI